MASNPSPKKRTRFGLIGCSRIAERRFIPALEACPNATIEHISSRDPEKAHQWATRYSSPSYGDYESCLKNPNVDAIYISTPNNCHEKWVYKAADHKKDILCEKPAVLSYKAAEKIIEYCKKKNVVFYENLVCEHHQQHQTIQTYCQSFGPLQYFNATIKHPKPKSDNFRLKKELNGGVLYDIVIYTIWALLFYHSELPKSIVAHATFDADSGVHNAVKITAKYAQNPVVNCQVGYGEFQSSYELIYGNTTIRNNRAFSINPEDKPKIEIKQNNQITQWEHPNDHQFLNMIHAFSAKCHHPNTVDHSGFLKRHLLLDAIYQSIVSNQYVEIEPPTFISHT